MARPADAFERLLKVAMELTAHPLGVTTGDLLTSGGYGSQGESARRTLMRDLDDLRGIGLVVVNRSGSGHEARYAIEPGDVRIRVEFTEEQQAQLQRIAATTDVGIADRLLPVDAERILRAVSARCLVRFRYNGRDREVDPYSLDTSMREFNLIGRDRGDGLVKCFALVRMRDLLIDDPGSALVPTDAPRRSTDPITWEVDEPLEATVEAAPGHVEEVAETLGGTVRGTFVTATVTNRLIFLARIIELRRVARLVGPEELRSELRDQLLAVKEAG